MAEGGGEAMTCLVSKDKGPLCGWGPPRSVPVARRVWTLSPGKKSDQLRKGFRSITFISVFYVRYHKCISDNWRSNSRRGLCSVILLICTVSHKLIRT